MDPTVAIRDHGREASSMKILRMITWSGLLGLATVGCPASDDTDSSSAASNTEAVTSAGGSDGADSGVTDGSASSGADDGLPPAGTCCTECPEEAAIGEACGGANVPPPCCTTTTLLLCGDIACGSQSCVGTWQASTCDCEARSQYYAYLLGLANACDPAAGDAACVLSPELVDYCGCAAVVDMDSPHLPAAMVAQQAWMDAGCGPMGCGAPCLGDGPLACNTDENTGNSWCGPAPG
jgi:hypothetical protein